MSADTTPAATVREFHLAYGLPVRPTPDLGTPEERSLRASLLYEETAEVCDALVEARIVGVAHELADVVYVAYGTAIQFGIDLDAVIAEVHRANMSKLGDDGQPIRRADGKILKGPNYLPPNISPLVPDGAGR